MEIIKKGNEYFWCYAGVQIPMTKEELNALIKKYAKKKQSFDERDDYFALSYFENMEHQAVLNFLKKHHSP
jgi:hypothetical protein